MLRVRRWLRRLRHLFKQRKKPAMAIASRSGFWQRSKRQKQPDRYYQT